MYLARITALVAILYISRHLYQWYKEYQTKKSNPYPSPHSSNTLKMNNMSHNPEVVSRKGLILILSIFLFLILPLVLMLKYNRVAQTLIRLRIHQLLLEYGYHATFQTTRAANSRFFRRPLSEVIVDLSLILRSPLNSATSI